MSERQETVDDIVRDMRAYDSGEIADVWMHRFADRIEFARRREKAELRLALDAEKARHTDTYKDERIRAQDAEIKTLKSVLKIAEDTLTKISKDDLCGHREQAARALYDIRAEGGES